MRENEMPETPGPASRVQRIAGMAMAVIYLLFGVALLAFGKFFQTLDATMRVGLGVILCLYGAFRFWRSKPFMLNEK